MSTKGVLGMLGVVTCVLLVTSCGLGSGSDSLNFPHTENELDDYPVSLIEGTLSIDRVGESYCTRVEDAYGESFLLVLPPTARVTDTTMELGSESYSVGDQVAVGGGGISIEYQDAGCPSTSSAWLAAP